MVFRDAPERGELPETYCMIAVDLDIEPRIRNEALRSPEKAQWEQAMREEYNSLVENDTWEVVPRLKSPIRKVLSTRWVYRRKRGAMRKVLRHKARYVVRGFSQVYGLDFDETFASVVKAPSYRLFFTLAAKFRWKVHQMDVKTAFLNGDIEHEIYIEAPEGFGIPPGSVLKLKKALYGLKQSPRQWYKKLRVFLENNGWIVSQFDQSVFFNGKGTFLIVYVDDILIFREDEDLIIAFKQTLVKTFQMTDLGRCSYYLGMHVYQDDQGVMYVH